jgi:preprotein translocase subunit SecF
MTAGLMMGLLLVVIFSSVNLLTSAVQLDVLTFMIIFGVAMNIFNTWFLGAGILLRYAERQRGKGYHVSL